MMTIQVYQQAQRALNLKQKISMKMPYSKLKMKCIKQTMR